MSLKHGPPREGTSAAALPSGQHTPSDPFEGCISVSPKRAFRAIDVGPTKGYELLNSGELESYLDGGARRILVSSIWAYIERRLAESARAARPQPAPEAGPDRRIVERSKLRNRAASASEPGPAPQPEAPAACAAQTHRGSASTAAPGG